MIYKRIYLLIFIISMLYVGFVNAQTDKGTVLGKVLTTDGLPAEGINVVLVNTIKGVLTDKEGVFIIKNIPAGNYTLQFSLLGLETKNQTISIMEGKTTHLQDVILSVGKEKLDEVIIVAQRLNQFAQKEKSNVTRLPLKNINIPQSYTVVSNALMEEQVVTDLPSAFKSITGGGYVEANSGQVSVYARGFRTDSRVKNGLPFYARGRVPTAIQNIERIEVIKGPSAVEYGGGFYGGVVNLVTKTPKSNDFFELSYNTGSFNLHRVTFDANKTINDNKYMFRVNGALHTENTFQKNGSGIRKNYLIAPVMKFNLTDNLAITLQSEFYKTIRNLEFARGYNSKKVRANTWEDIQWDYYNNYTDKDAAAEMDYYNTQLNIDFKFLDNWIAKTTFIYHKYHVEGGYFRLNALSDTKIQRQILAFNPEIGDNIGVRQDFVSAYDFDNVKNKAIIGVNYTKVKREFEMAPTKGFGVIDELDVSNEKQNYPKLTQEYLNTSIAGKFFKSNEGDETIAAYISNATTFYDKVTVLAGARYDDFKNNAKTINGKSLKNDYNQEKLSYNLGLVITPFNDVFSIYGNYMNGFNNLGIQTNKEGNKEVFKPEEVIQWEAGCKMDFFKGKLKSTLSYFNLDIDNKLMFVRNRTSKYAVQNGVVKSNGLEADIITNPIPGLNIVVGYTYINAKNIEHVKKEINNKKLVFTPDNVANIWASYKFTKGKLKGLGLGAGANYMSKIYAVYAKTNDFWSKPYTTVDGTVFYQQKKYRISVKVNNLLDKEYYNAYGIPQKPFNFTVGLTGRL